MTNAQFDFTVEEENEALVNFLRSDYDSALEEIRVLKTHIQELTELLKEHSIKIPLHIQEQIQLDELLK